MTKDATRDTTKGDTTRDSVTVTEAARRLGVSVRTVQRKLDSGELQAIRRDGKRRVLLSPDATTRQADATERDNVTRQKATPDATERDTAQAGSTPDLAAQLTQSREEILFLRGLVEQHQRSEAELRAALRKSLDAMPKALASGSTPDAEKQSRENDPQAPQSATGNQTKVATARRPKLTAWQRAAIRILGIRT